MRRKALVMKILVRCLVLMSLFIILGSTTIAQQANPARPLDPAATPQGQTGFKAPDNIDFRGATIMSEGVRLHAELFSLKSLAGKQLPTIIMAHGWGGTAANFRWDALA